MMKLKTRIPLVVFGLFSLVSIPVFAAQTLVVMRDGRIISGAIYPMRSVAELPNGQSKESENRPDRIIVIDDQLRRTYVPKYNVRDYLPDEIGASLEIFRIPQKFNKSGPEIAILGSFRTTTPFDEFGRRVLNVGGNPLVQAITEITPTYIRVQGVNLKNDMRISPHSIPRTTLSNLIKKHIDSKNLDERLRVYQFYVQAELFEQAEEELAEIIDEFQGEEANEARLDVGLRLISQLRADRLVKELELRQNSGQYHKVENLLTAFDAQKIAPEKAQAFRRMLRTYTEEYPQKRSELIANLRSLADSLDDPNLKNGVEPILKEIELQLNQNTMERFSEFQLIFRDTETPDDAKLAVGLSGWIAGNVAVDQRLEIAISMFNVRKLARKYLLEKLPNSLDSIWNEIQTEEASDPKRMARILATMQPPKKTPRSDPDYPYYYELSVPSYIDGEEFRYAVQLPPEYDPNRKYPTIITLHGEKTTPQMQIDWWAGPWKKASNPNSSSSQNSSDAQNSPGTQSSSDAQNQPGSQSSSDAQNSSGSQNPSDSSSGENDAADESTTKTDEESEPKAEPEPESIPERFGQATRFGYIVVAPLWTEPGKLYDSSAKSQAAVLYAMRDAQRRFSIDSDRVFLSGHSAGGDAAWDIGLSHPDLWAGIIPICGSATRFVPLMKRNAEFVPVYAIGGELDGGKLVQSRETVDWGMDKTIPFDLTYVQFKGRGNESFSDETIRVFDWMKLRTRQFYPKNERNLYSVRPWDNFFWNVELLDFPDKFMLDPTFSLGATGNSYRPAKTEFFNVYNNSVKIKSNAERGIVFLSPEIVDFDKKIEIVYNRNKISPTTGLIQPSSRVMLEDARTRADRQHPFWASVDSYRRGETNYWDKDAQVPPKKK